MKVVWRLALYPVLLQILVGGGVDLVSASDRFIFSHLSSTTRYADSVAEFRVDEVFPPQEFEGCHPIHINLVARHGTRAPTTKRLKVIEEVAAKLRAGAERLAAQGRLGALQGGPAAWLEGWRSPWHGQAEGGELLPAGEEELFFLAERLRAKCPELFSGEYHAATYPIFATQVPRASASAVAFGMGLFRGNGTLGEGRHRAFSVVTESKEVDVHLRFHDVCIAYKQRKRLHKRMLAEQQRSRYEEVAAGVEARYSLALDADDVANLWVLCKYQAAVLRQTQEACALFSERDVELLEWLDDVEMFQTKGYGDTINYRMGAHLLRDVVDAMHAAVGRSEEAAGREGELAPERARLRVAHAETVIPFTCLLGLFQEAESLKVSPQPEVGYQQAVANKGRHTCARGDLACQSIERLKKELPFPNPPPPPQRRAWRGSQVAPFGANTALVLFSCPLRTGGDNYSVLALHNEKAMVMPACGGQLFCPFSTFLEEVAEPHLQVSFESTCAEPVVAPPVKLRWFQRWTNFLLRRRLTWLHDVPHKVWTTFADAGELRKMNMESDNDEDAEGQEGGQGRGQKSQRQAEL